MSYNRCRFNYRKRGFSRGGSSSSGRSTPSNESSVQSFTNSANLPEVVRRSGEQPLISVALDVIPGPYPGWKLYFPLEVYTAGSQTVKNIKATESHIKRRTVLYNLQRCRKLLWYPIHMRALLGDPVFMEDWPMFQEDLREKPEYTLNCLGLAMHQVLSMQNESTDSSNLDMVMARVMGHGPVIPLKNIRVHSYSKLVTIKGTVIRAGNPKLLCTWMTFACRSCFAQQMVKQPAGVMAQPEKCVGENCLIRTNFIPILDTPCTRTTAWQTLKVQELKTADQFESGRVPRNVNIEVTADLVNLCCPGDDVTITGIVQVRALDDYSRRDQASMYKMYLEGISIQNQRENIVEDEYTERDYAAIQAIKSEPDVFRLLVNSLCPLICGRECPKAGLILALMGATKTSESDFINRNECHVLIVGDPGLGKSQMLKACADVAPRGVFVCGNTSTSSGLTASVTSGGQTSSESGISSGNSTSGVEAGALVLADGGVCCIDEFDKMTKQHSALLEAMEQQCVSLAKAGVVCSLPARCAVVAAANPDKGVYNRSKTLKENVNLSCALLSRFDLVFVLLDIPDEQLDTLLTEHVFSMHLTKEERKSRNSRIFETPMNQNERQQPRCLEERLRLRHGERFDPLPTVLMRKYISYARKNVQPKLTKEAAEEIKRFYLGLRQVRQGADSMPVTLRQLEALIRLTQARARVDLSPEAKVEHARDVIELTKISHSDLFCDGIGTFDVNRGRIPSSKMSQNSKIKRFLSLIQKRSEVTMKTIFTLNELKETASNGGLVHHGFGSDFREMIDKLNEQGCLLKKGPKLYQLLVV